MQANTVILISFFVITILLSLVLKRNSYSYKKQKYLLSKTELNFYKFLLQSLPSNISVMCKVRLADLISPNVSSKEYIYAFNKIKSKHIDFVLIDDQTSEIRALLELNGSSHFIPSRIIRDNFLKQIFEKSGIIFVEIPVKKSYSHSDLEKLNIVLLEQ